MPPAPLNVRLAVLWMVFISLPYFIYTTNIVWLLNRFWFGTAFAICITVTLFITIIKWNLMWPVINLWKLLIIGFAIVVALHVAFPPSSESYIVGMQLVSEASRFREAAIAAFVLCASVYSVSDVAAWLSELKREKAASREGA